MSEEDPSQEEVPSTSNMTSLAAAVGLAGVVAGGGYALHTHLSRGSHGRHGRGHGRAEAASEEELRALQRDNENLTVAARLQQATIERLEAQLHAMRLDLETIRREEAARARAEAEAATRVNNGSDRARYRAGTEAGEAEDDWYQAPTDGNGNVLPPPPLPPLPWDE